jgi:hypothetical protein
MRGLLLLTCLGAACSRPVGGDRQPAGASLARLALVYHETFDEPFREPGEWVEDRYGDDRPYHVDVFDEDGAFFRVQGGERFARGLAAFRSFRKSFTYGRDGWLTVELYGRDSDRDGRPESGGGFESVGGRARLTSRRHYDGAIVRSTRPLPERYRIEVTVSNIRFGGVGGEHDAGGKKNGADGDELADPWAFDPASAEPRPAWADNGVYFLCITDYDRPAPHNNIFHHHHRKVVMDTDNNRRPGQPWSRVWNPKTGEAEVDGDHYVSMLLLDGGTFGHDWWGNPFLSWTAAGWKRDSVFTDKYLDGETYVFAVERNQDSYILEARGRFHHGGLRTYRATRKFAGPPPVWHYNQRPEQLSAPAPDRVVQYGDAAFHTWPADSSFPDHFFFGDPHINYYEGSAEFDDLKLYLPSPVAR